MKAAEILTVWDSRYKDIWGEAYETIIRKDHLVSFKYLKRFYALVYLRGLESDFGWLSKKLKEEFRKRKNIEAAARIQLTPREISRLLRLEPLQEEVIRDIERKFMIKPDHEVKEIRQSEIHQFSLPPVDRKSVV